MTESQLEAHVILAIVGVGVPVIGFLLGLSLTFYAKGKRDRVRREMAKEIQEQNRQNGKH